MLKLAEEFKEFDLAILDSDADHEEIMDGLNDPFMGFIGNAADDVDEEIKWV